jgi:hypothetical protein
MEVKVEREVPRSRWEQQIRKDVTENGGRKGNKSNRRSCGKTALDGEAGC